MKILEDYNKEIEKIYKKFEYGRLEGYGINFFKKAIDILQCKIYQIFPLEINYLLALLQTALTNDLEFHYMTEPYYETKMKKVENNIDTIKLTISDFVELIDIINQLNSVNDLHNTKMTKVQRLTINSMLHTIFDICCVYIEKLFIKKYKNYKDSDILKTILDLRTKCRFYEITDNTEEMTKNKYSINAVNFLKEQVNKLSDFEENETEQEIQNINAEIINKYSNLTDEILFSDKVILDPNAMKLEEIWHFKEISKDSWKYYQFAFEYLRTIIVQLFSEKAFRYEYEYISYECKTGDFDEELINDITDGIVFCMSKGAIKSFDIKEITEFSEYLDINSINFLAYKYLLDNLKYIYKLFIKSDKFTDDDKAYMNNCIDRINLKLVEYLE